MNADIDLVPTDISLNRQPPLISIVTPTRNRRDLLAETMDSVCRQGLEAWEHIIVDDGSDDGTPKFVADRAKTDYRIRYLSRTGTVEGANVCRNQGTAAALAGLIVFLDSDDLLEPDCLEFRQQVMERNSDLDFAVFRAAVFERTPGDLSRLYHPQDLGDDLLRFLSLDCPWQTTGPIWRKSFLEQIGGFDETLVSMQDLELHVRALCARGRYICFPKVDHDIRWQVDPTKTSVKHFHDPRYIEAGSATRAKLFSLLSQSGYLTWSRRRAMLGLGFGAAESWLGTGSLKKALQTWTRDCRKQDSGILLFVAGILMLCLRRLAFRPESLPSRAVNKWKGLVRFRQEPSLTRSANTI